MEAKPIDQDNTPKKIKLTNEEYIKMAGYDDIKRITQSLQGNIWRATQRISKKHVAIKSSNISLHEKSIVIDNNNTYKVEEDILKETAILNYLCQQNKCPDSIIKYIATFKRYHRKSNTKLQTMHKLQCEYTFHIHHHSCSKIKWYTLCSYDG